MPTGFSRTTPDSAPQGATRAMPMLRRALTFPLWNRPLFDLLTSKSSIRFFLRKTWGSREIDEGLLEYDYLSTHQPDAQHAPYSFVSGFMFSLDIRRIYRSLTRPVWMAHGVRGDFTDYSGAEGFAPLPNWTIQVFPSGALPHFEDIAAFTRAHEAFLSDNTPPAASQSPGTGISLLPQSSSAPAPAPAKP